jgi:hypothetical protein
MSRFQVVMTMCWFGLAASIPIAVWYSVDHLIEALGR